MIVTSLLIFTAFLESPFTPVPPAEKVQMVGSASKSVCAKNASRTNTQGVANLPFAMGRRFATLDSYLTHLECMAGPVDLPWWKEIRPGVYQEMTTATDAPPNQVATRAELMRRFGFSR